MSRLVRRSVRLQLSYRHAFRVLFRAAWSAGLKEPLRRWTGGGASQPDIRSIQSKRPARAALAHRGPDRLDLQRHRHNCADLGGSWHDRAADLAALSSGGPRHFFGAQLEAAPPTGLDVAVARDLPALQIYDERFSTLPGVRRLTSTLAMRSVIEDKPLRL